MSPKLCTIVVLLFCVPPALQAGLGSTKLANEQETDNFVTETPSQIKCKEYNKFEINDGKNTCKISKVATETAFALLGEMPHMVMITSAYLPFRGGIMDKVCGGVLISENYVLSTGTCGFVVQMLNEEGDVFVRLGEVQTDFLNETQTDGATQVIKVANTILHPKFNREEDSPYNVAIFQLAIPAKFDAFVRPACLQIGDKLDDIPLIVSDWKRGDNHSHALRKSKSKAIPYEGCKLKSSPEKHIVDTEICVGRESDILCGDDGANVLQTVSSEPNCSYHIVGLSGVIPCWTNKEPQKLLFIRLAQFVPWIETVVWP